jgi:hypothetical protein
MYFYFHIKQKRNQHKLIPFTLKFIEIKKEPTQSVGSFRKRNYFATGPIIANMVPAATAVPITPATLGPIACMSRKLAGLHC